MKMTDKMIEILNQDTKAKMLLEKFNDKAEKEGINKNSEEYKEMRKTVVYMAMAMNPEIMDKISDEIYEQFNEIA